MVGSRPVGLFFVLVVFCNKRGSLKHFPPAPLSPDVMMAAHFGGESKLYATRDRAESQPVPSRNVENARSIGCGKFLQTIGDDWMEMLGDRTSKNSEFPATPLTDLTSTSMVAMHLVAEECAAACN